MSTYDDDDAFDEIDESMDDDVDRQPDEDDSIDEDYIDCPNCGASLYELAERCPHCGDYVVAGASPTYRSSTRQRMFTLVTYILVIALLTPFILILLRLLMPSE